MLFCLESHDCFEMLKLEAEMQMKIRVDVDGRFLCDAIVFSLEIWWNLPHQHFIT